jgi:hypothetical protein
MTIDRRLVAGSLGVALLLAACGGGNTATKAPTSAAPTQAGQPTVGTESAEPTEEATEEATDNGGGASTEDPATLNDLAKTLPREVNGIVYDRAGYNGEQLGVFGAAAGINNETLDPILKANGKTINDVNFAISAPADSNASGGGMVYAFQIEGLDAMKWMSTMSIDPASAPKTKVGGKDVYGQGAGGFGIWAYPKGDTLYVVMLTDEKTADAMFKALP